MDGIRRTHGCNENCIYNLNLTSEGKIPFMIQRRKWADTIKTAAKEEICNCMTECECQRIASRSWLL
jgi:hypothetical protein